MSVLIFFGSHFYPKTLSWLKQVDFACDGAGYPIFSLSPLAMHTRNLLADPRCTLVVQMPGWQGLSNARATIFGEVYRLPSHMQDDAREV